jgi:Asp-tRNA(Asn)/Glu-tRNA(Gln) amidotransferase A subunit family amidase
MVLADEISKLQDQLAEAETDLQESLSEVNHRVEAVDVRPRLERVIKEHPLASAALAVAAGAAAASRASRLSVLGALALGVLFGLKLGALRPEDKGG